jgi:hypothetical protein
MDQPSRILILSASAGAGHLRAAQAIEQALCAKSTCDVRHVDALDYTTKMFRRLYQKAYIDLVNHAPQGLGLLYDHLDKPWKYQRRRLAWDQLNPRPFVELSLVCRMNKLRPAGRIHGFPAPGAIATETSQIAADRSLRSREVGHLQVHVLQVSGPSKGFRAALVHHWRRCRQERARLKQLPPSQRSPFVRRDQCGESAISRLSAPSLLRLTPLRALVRPAATGLGSRFA